MTSAKLSELYLDHVTQVCRARAVKTFVRAQFNFDPKSQGVLNRPHDGLAFRSGDVLRVKSRAKWDWWEGETEDGSTGMIPSRDLVECHSVSSKPAEPQPKSSFLGLTRAKGLRGPYMAQHCSVFDDLDTLSYEEVVKLPPFPRRTLVLLGAPGVGRSHIKSVLLSTDPDTFKTPVLYTTEHPTSPNGDAAPNSGAGAAPGKAGGAAQDSGPYQLVSDVEMRGWVTRGEMVEYGNHGEAMLGLRLQCVRDIMQGDAVCVLDVQPQALKVLRSPDFAPFVVFVAPPASIGEAFQAESRELQASVMHLVDLVVVNEVTHDSATLIASAVRTAGETHNWVPLSWLL
ncbi:55 kDa erythrocyte membrane protein-like [Lampetra planeri]